MESRVSTIRGFIALREYVAIVSTQILLFCTKENESLSSSAYRWYAAFVERYELGVLFCSQRFHAPSVSACNAGGFRARRKATRYEPDVFYCARRVVKSLGANAALFSANVYFFVNPSTKS